MNPDRMLHKAVKFMYDNRQEGDMLADAPKTHQWTELIKWASDRKKWRSRVYIVRSGTRTTVSLQALFVPEQSFAFTVS